MKEKFPINCSLEQANKISKILYESPSKGGKWRNSFNIADIFNILPKEITYNGHRGDLSISICDITYFSVGGAWEHVLVHFEDIPIDGDVFDAFIKMLKWLKENNLLTKNE